MKKSKLSLRLEALVLAAKNRIALEAPCPGMDGEELTEQLEDSDIELLDAMDEVYKILERKDK